VLQSSYGPAFFGYGAGKQRFNRCLYMRIAPVLLAPTEMPPEAKKKAEPFAALPSYFAIKKLLCV